MLELVAVVVSLVMLAFRRESQAIHAPAGSLIMPAIEAPRPPHRLARGSIAQPVTPMPEDLPRRRAVIRPSHARR